MDKCGAGEKLLDYIKSMQYCTFIQVLVLFTFLNLFPSRVCAVPALSLLSVVRVTTNIYGQCTRS